MRNLRLPVLFVVLGLSGPLTGFGQTGTPPKFPGKQNSVQQDAGKQGGKQASGTADATKAPDVVITAALSNDTLAAGAAAEVLFTFAPAKGFHVNAVPPMAVAFESPDIAKSNGKIDIPADTATGYLRSSKPVRQPVAIASAAKKGRAELRGALTYYYCSDAEGWCRKESLRFTVPLTVK